MTEREHEELNEIQSFLNEHADTTMLVVCTAVEEHNKDNVKTDTCFIVSSKNKDDDEIIATHAATIKALASRVGAAMFLALLKEIFAKEGVKVKFDLLMNDDEKEEDKE